MQKASVWAEKVMIPTYEIGEAEKNPIFLEKRVYQGSCGKVYPYPTINGLNTTISVASSVVTIACIVWEAT